MPEKLNKDIVIALLTKADTLWFQNHRGPFNYREHLEFTADYINNNYNKEAKQEKYSAGSLRRDKNGGKRKPGQASAYNA